MHSKYRDEGLQVFALDAWDGTSDQLAEFGTRAAVTYPLLTEASAYTKTLGHIDDRGALFLIDRQGVVVWSCDDGYKSLACVDSIGLDSAITDALDRSDR
jgi:hypothetical protein